MTDIYKLFKKETWKPDNLTKTYWYRACIDELTYNKGGDIDELMNGNGKTYTYQVRDEVEKEEFVIFTLQDDYGGESFQAIFDLSKKVDEDKYWEAVDNEDEEE